jgi:hypothetical protein
VTWSEKRDEFQTDKKQGSGEVITCTHHDEIRSIFCWAIPDVESGELETECCCDGEEHGFGS